MYSQLFWHLTIWSVRHTVSASELLRNSDTICVLRSIFTRVRKIAKSVSYLRRGCLSFLLQLGCQLDRFSWNLLLEYFFEYLLRKFEFHLRHHVPEGLGVFPVPWSSKWSWSLRLFFGRPIFLRPFGIYHNVCFGILFVSILCTCCSQIVLFITAKFT